MIESFSFLDINISNLRAPRMAPPPDSRRRQNSASSIRGVGADFAEGGDSDDSGPVRRYIASSATDSL